MFVSKHFKHVYVFYSYHAASGCAAAVAVVSNHCGWADILIHMARYFPAFVARDATQNLAMIGLIRFVLCV